MRARKVLAVMCVTACLFGSVAGSMLAQLLLVGSGTSSASALLPAGAIVFVSSGSCPVGFTEYSALDGRMVYGTVAAHSDVGGTGGNNNITPAGTNSAPAFTGNSGSVPAETVAWPAGVPTFTGNSVALSGVTAAAQTFTGQSSTTVVNHTHTITNLAQVEQAQGGTTASTTGTHLMTSVATGGSLRSAGQSTVASTPATGNPVSGGAASYTPAGTNGSSAVSGSHTATGTVAWPAGVPTNGTVNFTPTGTVAAPTFTGTSFDNRAAYVKLIACSAM